MRDSSAKKPIGNVVPIRKGKKAGQEISAPYKPTPQELKATAAFDARMESAKPAPRMKAVISEEESRRVCAISVDHADAMTGFKLLNEALASNGSDFLYGFLEQLSAVSAKRSGEVEPEQLNFLLAAVRGIEPRDQVETMLASQMAVVQGATMKMAAKMNKAATLAETESYERAFTRLSRTFVAQVEGLKRYRSKGEQRVIVERVTVNEGGQAIVGNVAAGVG